MPPTRRAYLIRWEDGTMRTVQAHSVRGAAVLFVGTYAAPVGGRFAVKLREAKGGGLFCNPGEEWQWFSRTRSGVRQVRG